MKMVGNYALPVSQRGFSLLELLTVLIMLGVIAGVSAPAIGKMLTGLDFRKQVGSVMANLRAVRLQAVVTGREIRLSMDGSNFQLDYGKEELEEKILDVDSESEISLEPEVVIFTPYSTVTPAMLSFSLGERSRSIFLDPLTALPVIE